MWSGLLKALVGNVLVSNVPEVFPRAQSSSALWEGGKAGVDRAGGMRRGSQASGASAQPQAQGDRALCWCLEGHPSGSFPAAVPHGSFCSGVSSLWGARIHPDLGICAYLWVPVHWRHTPKRKLIGGLMWEKAC